jgi:hypothetical protein
MSQSPPKSPQEKKALSYAKDRRNAYGENAKASRKAIPLRKAGENREDRRKVNQDLAALPELDEAAAALIESSARHEINRVRGWKKHADIPLAQFVEMQSRKRSWRGTEARRLARRKD